MHSQQMKREEKTVVISLPLDLKYIVLALAHWCLIDTFIEEKSGYGTKSAGYWSFSI